MRRNKRDLCFVLTAVNSADRVWPRLNTAPTRCQHPQPGPSLGIRCGSADDDAAIAGPSVDVQIEDGVRKGKCGVGAQSSALALPRPRAELSMACTAIVWPQCGNTHHHPACLAKFSQCPEKAPILGLTPC